MRWRMCPLGPHSVCKGGQAGLAPHSVARFGSYRVAVGSVLAFLFLSSLCSSFVFFFVRFRFRLLLRFAFLCCPSVPVLFGSSCPSYLFGYFVWSCFAHPSPVPLKSPPALTAAKTCQSFEVTEQRLVDPDTLHHLCRSSRSLSAACGNYSACRC